MKKVNVLSMMLRIPFKILTIETVIVNGNKSIYVIIDTINTTIVLASLLILFELNYAIHYCITSLVIGEDSNPSISRVTYTSQAIWFY